jgi:hypothetical protein
MEPDVDPRDLEEMYKKDQELLEDLVLDYRNLMMSIDVLELNPDLKQEMIKEKIKFETTFVKIRCDILTSRAQIEESLDELSFKNGLLKKKDEDLEETNKLIKHFENQIKMYSSYI